MNKVLTLGMGTLAVELDGLTYSAGDRVGGVVKLELDEPLSAKRLVVGVDARQRIPTPAGQPPQVRRAVLWRQEQALIEAETFGSARARFGVKLPLQLGVQPARGAAKAPLEWSVYAYLDRPWAVPVKARVAISVALRARKAAAQASQG